MSDDQTSQVTLRVTDSVTYVIGKMHKELYTEFKHTLGYKDPTAIWKGKRAKNWDGFITTVCYNKTYCKCSIKKDGVHFPTGLYSRAAEFFRAYGVSATTIDERVKPSENTISISTSNDFQVRDYQQEVIDKSIKQQRGIIKIATGGGKTAIGAGIIQRLSTAPFIFYVTSNDLLKQAKDELQKFLVQNGSPLKVGSIGGGKFDIRDVNVMTVQTAIRAVGEKYKKFDDEDEVEEISEELQQKREAIAALIHNAKGMICDEVQHWAAETCQVLADHSVNARYRFGMSATPWRDMGDDLLIDSCFGKLIHEINASFLIRKGILVKPTIYFVHTGKRMDEDITYPEAYKQGIVENDERNLLIGNIAQNMVKEGRHLLILVRQIDHGNRLEQMIPDSFFVNGSHSQKVRAEHIQGMREKKTAVTIATSIFDEGVDVKPLDGLILAGSGKSQTRALQRIGRIIRTFNDPLTGFVKKDAFVVDFHDRMKYMMGHSNARRRIYETEPEFTIKDFKGA